MMSVRPCLLAGCLIAAVAGSAFAQDSSATSVPSPAAPSPSGWHWIVEPYLLIPNMSGTSGMRGLTSDVKASSSDIFNALDFGAMLYVEMHNNQWAVALDGTYMDLGVSGTTKLGSVDVDLKQTGVMALGYRRVEPWAEAMLGFQFNSIKGSLKASGPVAVELNDDQTWVDPYLGARLTLPRNDNWRFGFNGFLGGFGIGSDFAWQVYPNLGYRFNDLFELNAGYRAIYMDYTHDSGSDEFTYKMTTFGPQVGGMFHF
jgi:hypothetical protein